MTTKEYLMQIKNMKNEIRNQEEYIQRIRESLSIVGITYDKEKVQSFPDADKFTKVFAQIYEEEEKLQQMKEELVNIRIKIINQIHQLEDRNCQNVLYLIYVDGKNLKKAAQIMAFSYEYIKEIHITALTAFEQKFPP